MEPILELGRVDANGSPLAAQLHERQAALTEPTPNRHRVNRKTGGRLRHSQQTLIQTNHLHKHTLSWLVGRKRANPRREAGLRLNDRRSYTFKMHRLVMRVQAWRAPLRGRLPFPGCGVVTRAC